MYEGITLLNWNLILGGNLVRVCVALIQICSRSQQPGTLAYSIQAGNCGKELASLCPKPLKAASIFSVFLNMLIGSFNTVSRAFCHGLFEAHPRTSNTCFWTKHDSNQLWNKTLQALANTAPLKSLPLQFQVIDQWTIPSYNYCIHVIRACCMARSSHYWMKCENHFTTSTFGNAF